MFIWLRDSSNLIKKGNVAMGCFRLETPLLDAYVRNQRETNAEIKIVAPGNSTTSKVLTFGIAFFSLGTALVGCIFIATGTIPAAGAYAMLSVGGFVFILDAAAICLARRSYRLAVKELDSYLAKNDEPQITLQMSEKDSVSLSFLTDNYHVQVSHRMVQGITQHVLYFTKKYPEKNRTAELIEQPFNLSQIRTFSDGAPLIDLTNGAVTIKAKQYESPLTGRKTSSPEEIYINGTRVVFSNDLSQLLVFGRKYYTNAVIIQETAITGVYKIVEYQTDNRPQNTWTVDTRKQIQLEANSWGIISYEPVYLPDEELPHDFEALEPGFELSTPTGPYLTDSTRRLVKG